MSPHIGPFPVRRISSNTDRIPVPPLSRRPRGCPECPVYPVRMSPGGRTFAGGRMLPPGRLPPEVARPQISPGEYFPGPQISEGDPPPRPGRSPTDAPKNDDLRSGDTSAPPALVASRYSVTPTHMALRTGGRQQLRPGDSVTPDPRDRAIASHLHRVRVPAPGRIPGQAPARPEP